MTTSLSLPLSLEFFPPKTPEGTAKLAVVRQELYTLCEVAGRGGNLLLNVSPMGDGSIMPEQRAILGAMQRWLSGNGESIAGTEPGLEPW